VSSQNHHAPDLAIWPSSPSRDRAVRPRHFAPRCGRTDPGRRQYGLMHTWLLHTRPRTQALSQYPPVSPMLPLLAAARSGDGVAQPATRTTATIRMNFTKPPTPHMGAAVPRPDWRRGPGLNRTSRFHYHTPVPRGFCREGLTPGIRPGDSIVSRDSRGRCCLAIRRRPSLTPLARFNALPASAHAMLSCKTAWLRGQFAMSSVASISPLRWRLPVGYITKRAHE
jgi:hypothetical protein